MVTLYDWVTTATISMYKKCTNFVHTQWQGRLALGDHTRVYKHKHIITGGEAIVEGKREGGMEEK